MNSKQDGDDYSGSCGKVDTHRGLELVVSSVYYIVMRTGRTAYCYFRHVSYFARLPVDGGFVRPEGN